MQVLVYTSTSPKVFAMIGLCGYHGRQRASVSGHSHHACSMRELRVVAARQRGDNFTDDCFTNQRPIAQAMTDSSLLQRMANGDPGADRECYNQYRKLIWSIVCRFCSVPAEREDAMQEIFVEIWRSAKRFDPAIAKETTFVGMIARRRMIDRLRRNKRIPATDSIDDMVELDAPGAYGGEDEAELEVVGRFLSELSKDQQRAIRMSVVHGYSHGEIAERTGMPIGTVKTHIRRGLILLRERLQTGEVLA